MKRRYTTTITMNEEDKAAFDSIKGKSVIGVFRVGLAALVEVTEEKEGEDG